MPELPEVETILRGLQPRVEGKKVQKIIVRQPQLRWEVPEALIRELPHQIIQHISRRGKYLLFTTKSGTLIIHLGMSGFLRILHEVRPVEKHDHVDIVFKEFYLRYTDPRRFGAILWTKDPQHHPLLAKLGVEPLTKEFTGKYLLERSRDRIIAVKQFIMDSHVVVGVGNIYANEALFLAGINPLKKIKDITRSEYDHLATSIKTVLRSAVKEGGTTLRDFQNSEGKPGYFTAHLSVYGRTGLPCKNCGRPLEEVRIQGRSTVSCRFCQK